MVYNQQQKGIYMTSNAMNIIKQGQKLSKWNDYLYVGARVRKAIDFYNNNQKSYMFDHWRRKLDMDEYTLIKDNIAYYPITRQVIDEVSKMYQNGLSVTASRDGNTVDDTTVDINRMIDDCDMISILRYVNQMVELTGSCAVVPYTINGKVRFYVLTRDSFIVEQDPNNPSVITAFYYNIQDASESTFSNSKINKYYKITDEYTQEVSINTNTGVVMEESVRVINNLGRINAVIFSSDVSGTCLLGEYSNPLIDMNTDINSAITKLNVLIEMQSFSTLVVTGATSIEGFKYGETRYLQLSGSLDSMGNTMSPNASFISPNAKLSELDNIIENKMERCANAFGIGASAFKNDASSYSSGYQLRLSKEDVLNSIAQKRPLYERSTRNLIGLCVDMYNTVNQQDMIVGYDKISVTINEPTYDISASERLDILGKKLELGLMSKVGALMETNGISRDDAIAMYNEILAENAIARQSIEQSMEV